MPLVKKQKICQIAPNKAFEIVKDFEKYPQFLPWCAGARLLTKQKKSDFIEEFMADLVIKYTIFSEVLTSKVTCDLENYRIDIAYVKGSFKHLKAYWRFDPVIDQPDQTHIEFMIDFEMKFSPIQKVISLFFEEAMRKMINAFEARFKAYNN